MKITSTAPHSPPSQWSEFLAEIERAWSTSRWRDVGVIVGCSGGADSVALVRGLAELRQRPSDGPDARAGPPRGSLVAAHFNHALRADQSDADEDFVRMFADRLGIGFCASRSLGTARDEAAMRSERLAFLVDTAHRSGARYIAMAHSRDDNVETVLHNLMRGTGPTGLAGIRPNRPVDRDLVLIRPMLGMSRGLIRDALRAIDQPWREDASNTNTAYRRNWIRHELIPQIESTYPGAVLAIGRAIESQRLWREIMDRLAVDWVDAHRRSGEEVCLRRDRQSELPIVVAAIQSIWAEQRWPRGEMTREHWLRIAGTLVSNEVERYSLPGSIDVVAAAEEVTLRRLDASDPDIDHRPN